MSEQPSTPELDKMAGVTELSQPLGEFLTWLGEQGVRRWRWVEEIYDDDGNPRPGWVPDHRGINELLAAYFQIDLAKVDLEKRMLLEWWRVRSDELVAEGIVRQRAREVAEG
jgi:hypothetical protein